MTEDCYVKIARLEERMNNETRAREKIEQRLEKFDARWWTMIAGGATYGATAIASQLGIF